MQQNTINHKDMTGIHTGESVPQLTAQDCADLAYQRALSSIPVSLTAQEQADQAYKRATQFIAADGYALDRSSINK